MNTRALTLAVFIAVFAMFMVYTYIDDQKSAMIKEYGTQSSVVVAKNAPIDNIIPVKPFLDWSLSNIFCFPKKSINLNRKSIHCLIGLRRNNLLSIIKTIQKSLHRPIISSLLSWNPLWTISIVKTSDNKKKTMRFICY